jgi:hypothetical protein
MLISETLGVVVVALAAEECIGNGTHASSCLMCS